MTRRIAIVGAESTGKTWLARELADCLRQRGLQAQAVPEVLRDWCTREGRTPRPEEQPAIARQQAKAVLAVQAEVVIADTTPLMTAVYSDYLFGDDGLFAMALDHQRLYAHTLVTGLDLPWVADGLQRDGPHVRAPVDQRVRQALTQAGLAHAVVYGRGLQRLNNALLALGWPPEDGEAWQQRQQGQYALNAGRTPWLCEKCSDPDCEHRLFTGLLQRGGVST